MTNAQPLRIGILRLTDSAPIIMAQELGFFRDENLAVEIVIEPSWANVADKLAYGQLDAAVMLPPLVLAVALGLRGTRNSIVVPMGLSLNGNSVTVSRRLADTLQLSREDGPMEVGARVRGWLKQSGKRLRFGVVHAFSTHNFLLRYWLAAQQIDPDREVEIIVTPPAETAEAMRNSEIDGFCAGAPWGAVAEAEGVGRMICFSSQIWRNHPEKCLAVAADLAREQPDALNKLIAALLRSGQYCNDPANAQHVAETLSQLAYLVVSPSLVRASLPEKDVKGRSVFSGPSIIPSRSGGLWFLSQMARWGFIRSGIDATAILGSVYRPDLLIPVANRVGIALPAGDSTDLQGFCDGVAFDPQAAMQALAQSVQNTG